MNENVTHSVKPAAVASRRSARSCSRRSLGEAALLERGEGRRQAVVAVVARDFLDQIDVARRRRRATKARDAATWSARVGRMRSPGRSRMRRTSSAGDVGAQHPRGRARSRVARAGRGATAHASIQPGRTVPAPICSMRLTGARQRLGRRRKVGAALEPIRRFGRQAEALARPPDRRRLEPRAFERDGRRRGRHLAVARRP